jgi:hypothetical protein
LVTQVFVWIQSLWAGENGGGATCVDVVDDSMERFWCGGAGLQQRWKFLEQLLYLGWESSDGGGISELHGVIKEEVLVLEKVQPKAACRTCCFEWK